MTQRSFNIALQKGDIGEAIIQKLLEEKGWSVYRPDTDGAHCFDMLAILNKAQCIAVDVKAKAAMKYYPATGINQKHFEEYQRFSKKHLMPFWLFFVDENSCSIYGNTLDELEKPRKVANKQYPMKLTAGQALLRVWPLDAMKVVADITPAQAASLKKLSQRNYDY